MPASIRLAILLWVGCSALNACGEAARAEAPAQAVQDESDEAPSAPPLVEVARIELGQLEGRLDHMAIAASERRLFVAAREAGAVAVVDLETRAFLRDLPDIPDPRGVVWVASRDRIVVSSAERGTLEVIEPATLERKRTIKIGRDADRVVWDAASERLFVAWGEGAVSVIETENWNVDSQISLSAHPEGLVAEAGSERLFVALPERASIELWNRRTQRRIASWKLDEAGLCFPLALFPAQSELLVGCRDPHQVLLLDARSGRERLRLDIEGDVDDLVFDPVSRLLVSVCGSGWLVAHRREPDGTWKPLGKVRTQAGARTAVLDPERNEVLVGYAGRSGRSSEIRVWSSTP